jgi:hypothetical protein
MPASDSARERPCPLGAFYGQEGASWNQEGAFYGQETEIFHPKPSPACGRGWRGAPGEGFKGVNFTLLLLSLKLEYCVNRVTQRQVKSYLPEARGSRRRRWKCG